MLMNTDETWHCVCFKSSFHLPILGYRSSKMLFDAVIVFGTFILHF